MPPVPGFRNRRCLLMRSADSGLIPGIRHQDRGAWKENLKRKQRSPMRPGRERPGAVEGLTKVRQSGYSFHGKTRAVRVLLKAAASFNA